MVTMDFVDRLEAHQCATGEPDQQLGTDDQRQPFVQSAGAKVKAMASGAHRPVLKPEPDAGNETGCAGSITGVTGKARRLADFAGPFDTDIGRKFAGDFVAQPQA